MNYPEIVLSRVGTYGFSQQYAERNCYSKSCWSWTVATTPNENAKTLMEEMLQAFSQPNAAAAAPWKWCLPTIVTRQEISSLKAPNVMMP